MDLKNLIIEAIVSGIIGIIISEVLSFLKKMIIKIKNWWND